MTDFQTRLQQAIGTDYLLERELGGAGMSRVFVATERALQRRVVIKVMPPEMAAGVNVERFRREIQLAAGLQHPHIVPLLSAGDDDGLLWYSMPYIEGESLRSALKDKGRLPPREVIRILHDVVDALAYAHERGIVHRDIKPDNILTSGMHALVTDFGVAKALSAASPTHGGGTTAGMAIGTPAYMAPEQLAADPAANHRIDIYAVGLLAYELLTGQSPFTSSSPQMTLAAQLTKVPEPPHRSFADIPVALSTVIMLCLEKDAAKRPQSAVALLAELDALPPMGSAGAVAAARPRSKRPLVAVAVVVVLVATAVFAGRGRSGTGFLAETASAAPGQRRPAASGARDIGPGGSRTPGMDVAGAPAVTGTTADAARQRPETVIVIYRDTGVADAARGVSVPLVISRAESLAIAEAVRQRVGGGRPAGGAPLTFALTPNAARSATAAGAAEDVGALTRSSRGGFGSPSDSGRTSVRMDTGASARGPFRRDGRVSFEIERDAYLSEVKRVFTDSMRIALHSMDSALATIPRFDRLNAPRPSPQQVVPLVSPNTDGRTRVVVANFSNGTGKQVTTAVARDLSSYLRAAIPSDRFDVVDQSTTDMAARGAPDRMALGWSLRADYVVSGVVRERNDSLSLVTIFTDVRGGHNSRAGETMAPLSNAKQAFDGSLARVNGWLDSARTGSFPEPRKRPPREQGM